MNRSGSRMFIYKQNPSVTEFGLDSIFIHTPVEKGPQDELLCIVGVADIPPDENGDFLILPKSDNLIMDSRELDAIHTFSVCRLVLTMYQRAFKRLDILTSEDKKENGLFDFKKKWGKRLEVYIRAREGSLSAFFTSKMNTIFFGYKENIFTCRCFDIIAHEMGHAVLDALKTGHKKEGNRMGLALEEAFCDLTVVFAFLSQMDMCNMLIGLSKGKMSSSANYLYICGIAEELGRKKSNKKALRDVSKIFRLKEVKSRKDYSRYDLSLVFSSAVYGFLIKMYEEHLCLDKHDPAATLFEVGKILTDITLGAFYQATQKASFDFKTVGKEMIKLLKGMKCKSNCGCSYNKKKLVKELKATFREHQIFK